MGAVPNQRRLAAILAADVAGYTRLVEKDTDATVAAWTAARDEVITPGVAEKSGHIIKFTGDGFLVEFPSVQDAVDCAIQLQEKLATSSLDFRMGINLGDITDDGGDVHGEGVNIAARLEALAEPGGICVSGMVHDSVRNRINAVFRDMGEQKVKHVSAPVRAFAIDANTAAVAAPPPVPEKLPAVDKPSIAVLPFDNLSGDPEQEYFADGISEDIITDLSRISALFVIARNSTFSFKGQAIDIRKVAAELGVRFILEGSVRKAGNRVRVTAQLIDGADGGHLWADRYDRELEDIFAVQDEVTANIVEALKVQLTESERSRMGVASTDIPEAYDATLRARELIYDYTAATNAEAQAGYRKAIALDPGFSTPYSGLAFAKCIQYTSGWSGADDGTLQEGFEMAQKAVALAPEDPIAHRTLGLAYTWKKDLDRALAEIDKAIGLDPNCSEAYGSKGYILTFRGRPDEAIESLNHAMRLNPLYSPIWLHFMAHAEFMRGNYEKAVELSEQRIRVQPQTDISRVLMASALGHLGRPEAARAAWAEVLEINPDYSVGQKARILPYTNPADWNRFVAGLRKAGVPVTTSLKGP
ncbi:MAG: adenylate/guanylate cyclase domain-containing protein [Rhodospirillales bacterium]|nr:adenylate/guanylate cyclase domain-containing protein [Rhodospirillales bacterium]